MHDVCICTACHEACAQSVLKHVARSSCVLAYNDLGLLIKSLAVIPAEGTADLDSVLKVQILGCLASEAVRTEILSHFYSPLCQRGRSFLTHLAAFFSNSRERVKKDRPQCHTTVSGSSRYRGSTCKCLQSARRRPLHHMR